MLALISAICSLARLPVPAPGGVHAAKTRNAVADLAFGMIGLRSAVVDSRGC
jgi:hypothetical protein